MMWLPDRPKVPVIDDWPPKSLSIYADIDYERKPAMTDDQAKTPKPGDPEPAPPVEETEPALEEADTTTTTTTTETTTEDPA